MAIDDIGFYNVLGEYITRGKLVEQMSGYYNLKLNEGETRITDFNEGSEIRNLLEAIAVDHYILMQQVNEAGNIAFIQTAEGFWLDKHGANPFINLPRNQGSESSGELTFTLASEAETITMIPSGTIVVSESTGLEFLTQSDCVIYPDELSNSVNAVSISKGEDTNVPAEDITIILDLSLPNDLSVTNVSAFSGGVDVEDDDVYRERLLAHVRQDDFGSIGYYTKLLSDIPGVHDVALVDATGYTKKALVNGYSKPVSDSILLEALSKLTNVENIVLGHSFTVDAPAYKVLNLDISLEVTIEYSETQLQNIIETYINGGESDYIISFDGYIIGQDLMANDLHDMFFVLDHVVDVGVVDSDTGVALVDVSVGAGEVVKLGTVSWSQTVVE